jgi:hypothetical protein
MRHVYSSTPLHDLRRPSFAEGPTFSPAHNFSRVPMLSCGRNPLIVPITALLRGADTMYVRS